MRDPIFDALVGGIAFDAKRLPKDATALRAESGKAASTSAPAAPQPSARASTKSGTAKRKKRKQAGGSSAREAVEGIAVFGSAGGGGDDSEDGGDAQGSQPGAAAPKSRDPFEEANLMRKQYRIRVAGGQAPSPLHDFGELVARLGCPERLALNIEQQGYAEPTPIQRQAIPALLKGHELFAIAPTGSGKTLAFLVPMLTIARSVVRAGGSPPSGPLGVVISPTRELSAQSHRVLMRAEEGLGLKCLLLTKPAATGADFSKVHVLTATPLLLARCLKRKASPLSLASARLLVLDEADRLFEEGLLPQVDAALAAATHPNLVRALFSATLPEQVEEAARSVLHSPLRVTVGQRGASASSVAQRLVFVGQEKGKLLALRQILADGLKPPVLVFCSTRQRAAQLHRELLYEGVRVDSIQADQPPAQRKAAVDNFRAGVTWVLVATDLVGRGMDFVGVNTVVNYDFPRSTADYVHRVGRTGRAGRTGEAVTFFLEDDAPRLRAVANVMRAAGCEVPEWMLALKKGRAKDGKCGSKKRRHADKGGAVAELDETDGGTGSGAQHKKKKPRAIGAQAHAGNGIAAAKKSKPGRPAAGKPKKVVK